MRGTVWLTADRCDGTLTKVTRGKVAVRDLRRKRTIIAPRRQELPRQSEALMEVTGTRVLVTALLLALALAPAAQAKPRYLRFEVSVQGQQTVTWSATESASAARPPRAVSQTISFESPRPARLSLRRFRRTDPRTGKKRDFTYFGADLVSTDWTFTRTFEKSAPPNCPPPEEPIVAQASDCGTQGPFETPITVGWRGTAKPGNRRGGTVELRGILAAKGRGSATPSYRTCEYEATHSADLLHSIGRLSQRRLTSRRPGAIRVKVSEREKLPASESGSQTTTLDATVTLRRVQ